MRAHNFSAGPAVLPLSVIKRLQSALPEFRDTELGLMIPGGLKGGNEHVQTTPVSLKMLTTCSRTLNNPKSRRFCQVV